MLAQVTMKDYPVADSAGRPSDESVRKPVQQHMTGLHQKTLDSIQFLYSIMNSAVGSDHACLIHNHHIAFGVTLVNVNELQIHGFGLLQQLGRSRREFMDEILPGADRIVWDIIRIRVFWQCGIPYQYRCAWKTTQFAQK